MYQKAYGIIETIAPVHVGASAGEETGNLNLIFRDQFTQTGIIPGSSIRGRFRADMREEEGNVDYWYGKESKPSNTESGDSNNADENKTNNREENLTTEGIVKFEYASIVWIPVFCPNQPIVMVSSPALLRRYQKITGKPAHKFIPYTYFDEKEVGKVGEAGTSSNGEQATSSKTLFFNLGFIRLGNEDKELNSYMPEAAKNDNKYMLLVVDDNDISMIHDMALYRQSRVKLLDDSKKVDTDRGAFFNVEALPEGTVMVFPIAMRMKYNDQLVEWKKIIENGKFSERKEFYFGGLESIGFGRTNVTLQSHVTQ